MPRRPRDSQQLRSLTAKKTGRNGRKKRFKVILQRLRLDPTISTAVVAMIRLNNVLGSGTASRFERSIVGAKGTQLIL